MAAASRPAASTLDVMISLPLLLFAFYGMNTSLPFDRHPSTWAVLLLVSLAWVAGVYALHGSA